MSVEHICLAYKLNNAGYSAEKNNWVLFFERKVWGPDCGGNAKDNLIVTRDTLPRKTIEYCFSRGKSGDQTAGETQKTI